MYFVKLRSAGYRLRLNVLSQRTLLGQLCSAYGSVVMLRNV